MAYHTPLVFPHPIPQLASDVTLHCVSIIGGEPVLAILLMVALVTLVRHGRHNEARQVKRAAIQCGEDAVSKALQPPLAVFLVTVPTVQESHAFPGQPAPVVDESVHMLCEERRI